MISANLFNFGTAITLSLLKINTYCMTTLEMQVKTGLITPIINEENRKQPPCRYSVVELNERAQKAIRDYEAGKRLVPHKQIKRKEIDI
jgi:hypothetical protein